VAYHGVENRGVMPFGRFMGWLHSGRPCHSSPVFAYKYKGRESTRGGNGLKTEGRKKKGRGNRKIEKK